MSWGPCRFGVLQTWYSTSTLMSVKKSLVCLNQLAFIQPLISFLPSVYIQSLRSRVGVSERISITAWCIELLRHQDFFLSSFFLNHSVYVEALGAVSETIPRTWGESFVRWEAAGRSQLRGSPAILPALSIEGWTPSFYCRRTRL